METLYAVEENKKNILKTEDVEVGMNIAHSWNKESGLIRKESIERRVHSEKNIKQASKIVRKGQPQKPSAELCVARVYRGL